MNKIINFIKYHNAVPIILGVVLLAAASSFASEDVRNTVIGQKVESVSGIDNTQILAADLDNFDLGLKIQDVTQDGKNYYVNYAYKTLGILDNVWQEVLQSKTLTVNINSMEGKDLGLYVQQQLSQVADWEMNYLKRVQTDEKEKGITILTASVDYTGLIGLVLDARNKILPGYKPVVTEEICDGLDNDKNGQIDEGFDVGQVCLVGNGVCQNEGIYICSSDGKSVCSALMGAPGQEICDGIDNNCDGQIDDGEVCLPTPEPQPEPEPELEPEPPLPSPQIENPPVENPPANPEPPVNPETPVDYSATSTESAPETNPADQATSTDQTLPEQPPSDQLPPEQPPVDQPPPDQTTSTDQIIPDETPSDETSTTTSP